MNRFLSGVLVLLLMLMLAACGDRSPAEPTVAPTEPATATPAPTATPTELPAPSTVLEIATAAGNFHALLDAIAAADLTEKLSSEGPYTLFAPTDFAFSEAPSALLGDADALADTLLYHVVEGELAAADLVAAGDVTSLLGDPLTITVEGDQTLVNGAPIAITGIEAENGVIHVLQAVLVPPSLTDQVASGEDETAAGETDSEGAATEEPDAAVQSAAQEAVAAAEEGAEAVAQRAGDAAAAVQDAAADAVKAVEENVAESGATAQTTVDEVAQNVGDTVREAASEAGDAAQAATADLEERAEAELQTLTEAARNSGQAVTLMVSVEAAGLLDTLQTAGPYTLFAPVDGAFAALPESIIQALLREPSSALKGVLSYHVASGAFSLEELRTLDGQTLATLNGEPIDVSVSPDGEILIDGASILGAPIRAGNGYIYLIDTVLIPVIDE